MIPPTIATCSRVSANACPMLLWGAMSSSAFPARATAQFEARWSILRPAADLFSCLSLFVTARHGGGDVAGCGACACKKTAGPTHARSGRAQKEEFCAGFPGQRVAVLVEEQSRQATGLGSWFQPQLFAGGACRRRCVGQPRTHRASGRYRSGWLRIVIPVRSGFAISPQPVE